ncbi:uncharacterized protein [Rutidosis leptorrhynchoides]|uniref:uncharacterized protein n=1 Tax=Rutidosis leptorrhynchoides TaxID=125765 RepID=UPI003A99FA3B
MAYLAYVVDTRDEPPSIKTIHVVSEFEDVFPVDLSGVPPSMKEHEHHLLGLLKTLRKEKFYAKFSKREFWLREDYDLEILYHPGKGNVVADALSRKNQVPNLQVKSLRMILSNDFLAKLDEVQIEAIVNHKREERIQRQTESIVLGTHGLLCFQGQYWNTAVCNALMATMPNPDLLGRGGSKGSYWYRSGSRDEPKD